MRTSNFFVSKWNPLESKKNSPNNEKNFLLNIDLDKALEVKFKENPFVLKLLENDEKEFFLKWGKKDLETLLEIVDKIKYELDKSDLKKNIPLLANLAKNMINNHIMKASPSSFFIYFSNRYSLNEQLANSLKIIINSKHNPDSFVSFSEYAKTLISAHYSSSLANAKNLIFLIENFIKKIISMLNDIDPRNLPNLTSLIIDEAIEELIEKLGIHKLCLFPGKINETLENLKLDMDSFLSVSKTIIEYLIKKSPEESNSIKFSSIATSGFYYSKHEKSKPILKIPAIKP